MTRSARNQSRRRPRPGQAVLLALLLCAAMPRPAAAARFDQLIVFGDSLSDIGNNGRDTDGALWDEHVAGAFRLTLRPSKSNGTDYAICGALITADRGNVLSLPHQVGQYLAANPSADQTALYVIWGGGNDVFSTVDNPGAGRAIEQAGIADTVAMVKHLYAAGARNFVVGNVPRTDLTPLIQKKGSAVIAQQEQLVTSWNIALQQALAKLSLQSAHLWTYNSASLLKAVFQSPTHFTYKNYTTPCNSTCDDPDHTFFWDDIHPASTAHAQIASEVLELVTQ